MIDPRAKGAKAETDVKTILKKYTGLGCGRLFIQERHNI